MSEKPGSTRLAWFALAFAIACLIFNLFAPYWINKR